jgi:UDP-N-acetylglucosamine 1-carboxyvinyltransferase
MDMFVIRGGKPLEGTVAVGGAKNSALPLMAAALAAEGETILHGVPRLVDVDTLAILLETLGVRVKRLDAGELSLCVASESGHVADYELVRRMRASFCVLGPLLAKRGRACVSLPGGCNIGDRPIDLHLKGLRALGAEIKIERGYVVARAPRLRGAHLFLGGPFGSTVTGTCNVMVAAALAEGATTIEAAACEPEVVDLGNLLNSMGARIAGLGTPFLRIEGVATLHGVQHTVIPDRIEGATLMIAAAITRGHVTLTNARADHLTAVIEKLREIGIRIVTGDDTVEVSVAGELRPVDCIALPYPGFPTDIQAQLTALLTTVPGMSVMTEKVFPDRFMHAAELVRMGARIRREGNSAIVSGVDSLSGACVMASDLRASAALVLAGLAAAGRTVVRRIYHLDRGYESLESKLGRLGAEILRTSDEPSHVPEELRVDHQIPADVNPCVDEPHSLDGPTWLRRLRRSERVSSDGDPHADD